MGESPEEEIRTLETVFSLEKKLGNSNCKLKQLFRVQKLGQRFPMRCREPRQGLQGRLGDLRACREFRTNNSMCGLDVDVGAWQKDQQKSLVSLAEK